MNLPMLFLGGGPLDGLVGVAKNQDGRWPDRVVGVSDDLRSARWRETPMQTTDERRMTVYTLQRVAVPPGAVGTADGHRIRHGQLVYVRDGHTVRFETMTSREWRERQGRAELSAIVRRSL